MKLKKTIGSLVVATALMGGAWSGPVAACSGSEPILGSVCIFAGNFQIRGFAFTAGQLMSIAQNTALFSILGTTYGGNGQTTFALPDTRGRVVIGAGQGPGLSNYDLGQTGGSENVTQTTAQMPAHSHTATTTVSNLTATLNGNSTTGNADGPGGNSLAAKPRGAPYSTSAPNVAMASGSVAITVGGVATTVGVAGGSQPFSIVQPYVALNYLIALQGIFPSRD